MTTQDNDIETVVAEFREKCNEVRRDTHWGDAEDGPVHEFGLKTQRGDELFTITDFGNMEKWLRTALIAQRDAGKMEGHDEERGKAHDCMEIELALKRISEAGEFARAQALKEAVEVVEKKSELRLTAPEGEYEDGFDCGYDTAKAESLKALQSLTDKI